MRVYQYKARDKFGKLLKGVMGGESKAAVVAKLKLQDLTPISVSEAKKGLKIGKFFSPAKGVGFQELNMFNRQFAALQRAGIPILVSLNALKEQTRNKTLQDVTQQVMRDIEAGASLSSALERQPRIFNAVYVNMIRSGEVSGSLDEVLERLAALGEHEEKVRLRINAATRYPIIVISAIVIAFFVLVTLVMPRFARLYTQFNMALPLPTQILLAINSLITGFWWLLLLIIASTIFAGHKFIRTRKGRWWWDWLRLRVPVFGPLLSKLIMSRFTRLTANLLHSGIPIMQVLELTSESADNVVVAKTIDNIKISLTKGEGLVEPMKKSALFPPVVTQMVLVGEESGKIDELLIHVSDYYDAQIDYTISNLVALIEPMLILALGCMVLFMALGIFLPMWSLMRLFR